MLVWTLVAWLALGGALGRRHAPELREEEPARRGTRPAECQFGKQARELGSTWFADLGPPFGVMYCIKCECVSVQKKRRVVAKVQCRNIKNECPEPTCEQPVLLHGRCCKACPGDSNYPDLLQDIPVSTPDEDELSSKHFVSLLTARSTITVRRDDMTAVPGGEGIASARLALRRRHLQWALAATGGPRALLFLDAGARLLMEQPLRVGSGTQAQYQNATGKLCGVWRRVPREYRKMLREGTMYVALVWGDEKSGGMDTAISGQITRYAALSTEMFSALLTPLTPGAAGPRPSWGGTAVVAANAGAAPSVHVGVVFNGLFAAGDVANVAVRLVLEAPEKNSTVFEEIQTLSKPLHEWNIIEVSSPVTAAELRMLARGKLVIRLESPGAPLLTIRGTVGQLATCDLFQAPLAAERHTAELTGAGMAWMYIDAEGSLVYNVQIDGMLVADAPKITLVDEFGRRHTQVEILDTSIGVLARPSARIFSPLYEEQLGIHVGFETGSSLLKGRLLSRPVPDAADNGPVLMKRASLDQPAGLVGIAWISVDHLCSLHYDLTLSGSAIDTISSGAELYLETWPLLAPGAVPQYRHLNSISSSYTDGYLLEPSAVELTRLQNGVVFLELRGPNNGTTILKAQLKQINVPQNCLPQYSDNEVSSAQTSLPSHSNTPTDLVVSSGSTCFHSGSFYDDGAQWRSKVEACTMCGCVHGSVRCDPVRCPTVSCQGNSVTRPGECCPICTNSTAQEWNTSSASMQGCYLAGQFHAAGSSWHPYLVPGGYDTCAVCACEVRTLVVRCPRVKCPPLQCSDKVAFRPDKKSCCRTCPEIKETVDKKSEDGVLRDEPKPRTPEEILADGGCVFTEGPLPNGKEVHPNIHSHGEQKCVTCRCKDGILTCTRKRCARAACARRRPGEKRAAPDMCCVQQCRRPRRHPRRHRPPT